MTFKVVPSNVKLPLSSNSPPDPAITTLLSVKSPINAVSAEKESMFAVPSKCKFLNSLPAGPIYV